MNFESRVLCVKPNETGSVDAWTCHPHRDQSVAESFPLILQTPAWCGHLRLAGGEAANRLDVPPVAHFSPQLTVTLYAATFTSISNLQGGDWLPAETLLTHAEGQWRPLLKCLVSEIQHAVSAGFIELPESTAGTTKRPPLHTIPAHRTQPAPVEIGTSADNKAGSNDDADKGRSDESSEEMLEEGAAADSSAAPVQWQPGLEAVVIDGGHDVQAVLDSEGVAHGVVHWHASWIADCRDLQPLLQRLAAKLPSVAFMHLDVEDSMANKLLAYEKTLERADSRRRGAKPIVRNAARFPCISLHQPSNLVPLRIFTGPTALEDLVKELRALSSVREAAQTAAGNSAAEAAYQNKEPEAEKPATSAMPGTLAADQAAATAAPDADVAFQTPPATALSTVADDQAGVSKDDAVHIPPNHVKLLKKGAMEFKQLLTKGKQHQHDVVVLWMSGRAGQPLSLQPFTSIYPETTFVEADVTASASNRALAQALSVKAFPALQVYTNMRMMKHVDAASMPPLGMLLEEILRKRTSAAAAEPAEQPRLSRFLAPEGTDASAALAEAAKKPSQGESRATAGDIASASKEPADGDVPSASQHDPLWDPPPAGKAGAKKRFPGGSGIFWPKMPCLRCGCPWWTGEDWDAKCARCQWTCESDGYDDDSKPLPKLKKAWQEFTAAIQSGRTPDWP